MYLLLLLLLLLITLTRGQPPTPISLSLDEPSTQPISLLPSENGAFRKITFPLAVTPGTTLLAELHLKSTPPHSGPHAPLITAATETRPSDPDNESPCSQQQPCIPQPFDRVAFYTRADTASITLPIDAPLAYLTVYNWKLAGLPSTTLSGTLHLRIVESVDENGVCPGTARGNACRGKGQCVKGECKCDRGLGGPSCGTRLSEAPGVSDRPTWDGVVRPMRQSAVVSIPAEGITYVWRVSGNGRFEFRARLLKGDFVDGDRKSVDGGGGVFKMIVKQANDNLGEGLEEGTRLPTGYDEKGVGRVVASSGEVYEVVSVGSGGGNWLMGLVVDDGTAVVSVNVRRCGDDGLLDCAFAEEGGGFPVGVVVGVSVVGVVLISVAVVLCLCWARRRDRKERKSASGAWTHVDLSRIEAMDGDDSVR